MRIARDLGDLRLIAPGYEDLRDLPYMLWDAITVGLMYVTWMDELPIKKRPPRWMWQYPDVVKEWFESHTDADEDSDDPNAKLYIPDAVHNNAAKMLLSD